MSLYIEIYGYGLVLLVLLYGWVMYGGVFVLLVEVLVEQCMLYVVDLFGYG